MNIKDKLSSNPLDIANAFNTHFSSVAKNLLNKIFFLERTLLIIKIQYLIYIRILDSLFRLYNSDILLLMKKRKELIPWNVRTLMATMRYHQEF
jgi:hypothetical protein